MPTKPSEPNPPPSVARAIIAVWLLAALALVVGILNTIAQGLRGSGCITWAVIFVCLTVPGLARGHRGPRIVAVCGGAFAFLSGVLAVSSLGAPIPWPFRITSMVLGIALAVLGAAVVWWLTGPEDSRAWFRRD